MVSVILLYYLVIPKYNNGGDMLFVEENKQSKRNRSTCFVERSNKAFVSDVHKIPTYLIHMLFIESIFKGFVKNYFCGYGMLKNKQSKQEKSFAGMLQFIHGSLAWELRYT